MSDGIRVVRRDDISQGKAWLVRLCAIALALITGGVFVAVLGYDPLAVYQEMIAGSLGSRMSIELTVRLVISAANHLSGRDAGVQNAFLEHRRRGTDLRRRHRGDLFRPFP